ncbi:MAG TPA: phospho-N-acetylmuramoyl-pentapeptide-transferase [Candidatus Woesebacteria bacterium]|jgi:phospho-N-acetylmuramoyl-pentapeptide-transferase|nr:phospho-N-acetylmuramoyl-pentapeptide-transferase [Candidatus Woesebacteria bacterium]HNQ16573.1 phospho-N-acetylmuramoyl-pentapeptide-transferase [Candidatus Woesebacteria bacterium]HNS64891.1 phospho-N-acetylmuramoyl-pentapeptide-transferase [Candidatus Woesebacteria bacterium]
MGPFATALGILMLAFVVTSILIIPFVNLLYRLKFLRAHQITTDAFGKLTPIFDKFHRSKAGVPVGGGLLVIFVVSVLFAITIPILSYSGRDITSVYRNLNAEMYIIFFTMISFGLLGLYDDIKKFFRFKPVGFFGLTLKFKLILQIILASIISILLYKTLGINFIHVPFIGIIPLGALFVPFATITIVSFSNAVNITDGLDGLASGSLMISLFGLWFLSAAILDVPLTVFLALWLGSLISFLYFNVFPARIFMGDVGSLAFGATLAVVGLLLGKVVALVIIGFIFVLEISSSLLQLVSKKWRKKKIFPAAPIHLTLQAYGWEEPKIVQRAWLLQIMLTIFGVWLAVL